MDLDWLGPRRKTGRSQIMPNTLGKRGFLGNGKSGKDASLESMDYLQTCLAEDEHFSSERHSAGRGGQRTLGHIIFMKRYAGVMLKYTCVGCRIVFHILSHVKVERFMGYDKRNWVKMQMLI